MCSVPAAIPSFLMPSFSAKKARMSRTKLRATAGGNSNGLRGMSPTNRMLYALKRLYHVVGVSAVVEMLIGGECSASQHDNCQSKFVHAIFRSGNGSCVGRPLAC